MEACAFDSYLTQISHLSRAQCMRVLALLKPAVDQGRAADVIEASAAPTLCCPRCQGRHLYRHGTKSGLQRFRCRACGRTFNSLTGTPLARLRHKDKWLDFSDCMLYSRTVQSCGTYRRRQKYEPALAPPVSGADQNRPPGLPERDR